jgi:hypothetical protein
MVGAVAGTSTVTSYVESASGVEVGGRTGLTAIITGHPVSGRDVCGALCAIGAQRGHCPR